MSIEITVPEDSTDDDLAKYLADIAPNKGFEISSKEQTPEEEEAVHADEEEETEEGRTPEPEETEKSDSDEGEEKPEETEAKPEEEKPKDEAEAEKDVKEDKPSRPDGVQKAINRERARRAKADERAQLAEERAKKLEEELVKRLQPEEQEKYQQNVEQQKIYEKDLQLKAYESQQMFNEQMKGLSQEDAQLISSTPTTAFETKPRTIEAIQRSNYGAKALALLVKNPERLSMFERLSDAEGLQVMQTIANEVYASEQAQTIAPQVQPTVEPVKAPVEQEKVQREVPKPTPKPTKVAPSVNKGFDLNKASAKEINNWLNS